MMSFSSRNFDDVILTLNTIVKKEK